MNLQTKDNSIQPTYTFVKGGGEMGKLIRTANFSDTVLGNPETWSDSLRSAVNIALNSGFPIAIYWGEDFNILYNDSYSPILGNKHPWALGRPGYEAWAEIWADLAEEFKSVLYNGESIRRPDALLFMQRYGYTEECYFDYTLSPIIGPDGNIGGVFNAVIETTYRVINERRAGIIQQLLQQLNTAKTGEQSLQNCLAILKEASEDIPFFALYTISEHDAAKTLLAGVSGISAQDAAKAMFLYHQVAHSGISTYIPNLDVYLRNPVMSVWGDACREALVATITKGDTKINGYIVMGVSPRKKLDNDCQHFLESVALHVGTILNNGYSYEHRNALEKEQQLNEQLAAANEELNATNEELAESQMKLAKLNNELEERVYLRTKTLAERELQLQLLNEELGAINEELTATVEELATSNDQLANSQDRLLQSLQELSEKETIFRNLIEQAPVAIGMFSRQQLIITAANEIMLSLWGKTKDIIGKPLAVALPELEGQPFLQILENVFTTGDTFYGNEVKALLNHHGTLKESYFNFVYQAIRENNTITGIIAVATDVTEQVLSRQKVEESEFNLRGLIMTAHYSLMILRGKNWIVEIANQSLADLWGKTIAEITGRPLMEILPELEGQPFPMLLRKVYDTGLGYGQEEEVFYHNSPQGLQKKFVSFYYDPLFDTKGNVTGIIVAAEDITTRVEERIDKERAQQMLDMAIESAEMGTWFINAETREFIPSSRMKALFGYHRDEKMSYKAVVGQIKEEYREAVITAVEATISKGERFDLEFPITTIHDQKLRWMKATGKLYNAERGRPANFSGTILDITERKLDDIRKNDFIAMVSHELKTPLTSIKAYVQMLTMRAKHSGDAFTTDIINKAHTQVNKMTNMINSFLNVSRLEAGKIHLEKTTFNIEELVKNIEDEMSVNTHSHTIYFKSCKPLIVHADYEKIGQVITNLVSNAMKYSSPGKKIEIACEQIDGLVQISVKDEGVGIKPQNIDRLFERYYRVENKNTPMVSGFGIGLYLCAEIVQRHKGRIWVESELGKGSTFYFTIPLVE
ncbi:PAS domain S-box protein [Ilyomonas limi]|uniref:histidine kinase n=1 Tax=Ilyomonas limi TaxID=2575867 RepID=A0A4U3KZU5_9BACT|nr:ATP-binding protein [Ilyomonas limi]TKK68331.1 PAS domain S-box protein [Ilyomonas limi]